eukprot:SAG11_NODE_2272_length_3592_cov_2.048382_3_plen_65_part_00
MTDHRACSCAAAAALAAQARFRGRRERREFQRGRDERAILRANAWVGESGRDSNWGVPEPRPAA